MGKISSGAFKNSSSRGGRKGISIVDKDCITRLNANTERSECDHFKRYYEKPVGEPYLYIIFKKKDICRVVEDINRIEFEKEESSTGDPCHINLLGLTNGEAKKFIKKTNIAKPPNLYYCQGNKPVQIKNDTELKQIIEYY